MDPFHKVLTIECAGCKVHLVRVAPSEFMDLAICPKCMAAGTYDVVVEDPAELATDYAIPQFVRDFVAGLNVH
jgi:hypothetical protein